MRSLGIVRRIDELGRIVIPIEVRRNMDIKTAKEKGSKDKTDADAVEIFVDGDEIILRKYNPGCHCCGEMNNLKEVLGLKICPKCLKEFKKAAEVLKKAGEIK